ncbi:hypothetical protein IG631_22411 [Alternaria alternata]|nr:hypothetical protein IG631_22411 [Alternaria alternata]
MREHSCRTSLERVSNLAQRSACARVPAMARDTMTARRRPEIPILVSSPSKTASAHDIRKLMWRSIGITL